MYKLKNDHYRKARGGNSKFLTIYCSNCIEPLLLYQKDGIGSLKRLYLDRIFAHSTISLESPLFRCPHCNNIIGKAYTYEKEDRPAYLLFPGTFKKKVSKPIFPPQISLS